MKSSTAPQPHSRPDAASDIADAVAAGTGTSTHHLAGWCLHHYEEVTSTNDVAARFPAWHAVWSDRQNTGRGRHGRKWISQAGGLWLSAVVPAGSADAGWAALPMVMGMSVCQALTALGVRSLRLRWPNDVMHRRRKLGGLLIDQFGAEFTVVGIGVNLVNQPELLDPELEGRVTRLADLTRPCPSPKEVAVRILEAVRESVLAMHRGGFDALMPAVSLWWEIGVPFEVETADGHWFGRFAGVDQAGRLRLSLPDGEVRVWPAHQVIRAIEVEEGL